MQIIYVFYLCEFMCVNSKFHVYMCAIHLIFLFFPVKNKIINVMQKTELHCEKWKFT